MVAGCMKIFCRLDEEVWRQRFPFCFPSPSTAQSSLCDVDGVQEAFYLWGIYDIIAIVRAETVAKLTNIINNRLQLGKIHSKLTVVVIEPEEKTLLSEPLTC
jgi:DNA-binding Lrp family transcriptional regulator